MDLLDEGTLYVARFNEDGSGEWMPMIYGEGPLTEENGFASQADVLINTRGAADLLGADQDGPAGRHRAQPGQRQGLHGDDQQHPARHRRRRGANGANPRAENTLGHIIEVTEDGDDPTATTFTWDIFLLCGDPADESTYFAGFPEGPGQPDRLPDNITFDIDGNLWISTDGQPSTLEINDGLFAVPVDGR